MNRQKLNIDEIVNPILNSYSQVFFSTSKILAVFLLVISFFDYGAGIGGIIAVIIANILAYVLGYNKNYLYSGLYGFNALLVGLGIGLFYKPAIEVYVLIAVTSVVCFFLTIVFQGILGKYGLPFLSVPFLLTIWMVALASDSLSVINLSERGIYVYNELYALGGKKIVDLYEIIEKYISSSFIKIYFHSLGAIFFQSHLLAGIIIAFGLLIYSRITFLLSVLGYSVAYIFYLWIGIEFDSLGYSFIGFNYILTAIAIGGYYLIPGKSSFGWIIILLPAVVIITTSTIRVFSLLRISPYSLPFNVIVLVFLYALKLREKRPRNLVETPVQIGNPEKNLYLYSRNAKRFPSIFPVSANLPFYGEWMVSQAYNGKYTHKGQWRHAWDFVVVDSMEKQYKNAGDIAEDYYCFGKIILAVADGVVAEVVDNVEDNFIGDVNTNQNWGNTVIVKHDYFLFSKVSHLKFQSVEVKKGDNVKKGQVIGRCGNSGRSPYPHLHFQFQANPYVGSVTKDYPFGYYLMKKRDGYILKNFDYPKNNEKIVGAFRNEVIYKALHFIPGREMVVNVIVKSRKKKERRIKGNYKWFIETDEYNNTYIKDQKDRERIYVYNQSDMHYFINFVGKKFSPLFWFYVSLFKIPMSIQKNTTCNDYIPVHHSFYGGLRYLQDFLSPFLLFLRTEYKLIVQNEQTVLSFDDVIMESQIEKKVIGRKISLCKSMINIDKHGDIIIVVNKGKTKIKMICRNVLGL